MPKSSRYDQRSDSRRRGVAQLVELGECLHKLTFAGPSIFHDQRPDAEEEKRLRDRIGALELELKEFTSDKSKRVLRPAPTFRGTERTAVSPFWAAFFTPRMPRHSAGRIMDCKRPGQCPLLPMGGAVSRGTTGCTTGGTTQRMCVALWAAKVRRSRGRDMAVSYLASYPKMREIHRKNTQTAPKYDGETKLDDIPQIIRVGVLASHRRTPVEAPH